MLVRETNPSRGNHHKFLVIYFCAYFLSRQLSYS